jgi:hypothetical protein
MERSRAKCVSARTHIHAGTRIYAAILGTASAALLLPAGLSQRIGLTEFREVHRRELGLALAVSGGLLLIQLIIAIAKLVMAPTRRRRLTNEESK